MVTVWLSCRSDVVPSACFEIVTVGPNVTFTSQLVLGTVIDVLLRLVTVPRARLWPPAGGGAPGDGQAAATPRPAPGKLPDPLEVPVRVEAAGERRVSLFCPTL